MGFPDSSDAESVSLGFPTSDEDAEAQPVAAVAPPDAPADVHHRGRGRGRGRPATLRQTLLRQRRERKTTEQARLEELERDRQNPAWVKALRPVGDNVMQNFVANAQRPQGSTSEMQQKVLHRC